MAHHLLLPVAVALGATVLAVKKGWVGNPLDKIKALGNSGVKTGQLGSPQDLSDGAAAIQADLQRYAEYPGSSPGYSPYGYGFGYAQQNPYFGQGAYPMQNPYYGQQWFSQSGPASLAPGGMVAQWHTR